MCFKFSVFLGVVGGGYRDKKYIDVVRRRQMVGEWGTSPFPESLTTPLSILVEGG